jgi:starch phosphorylase
MTHLRIFQVLPNIPETLFFLEVLARNLWWSWQKDAIELFRRINPPLWVEAGRNPIVFLTRIPQERFEELSEDDGFLAHLERVRENFEQLGAARADHLDMMLEEHETIAYFSMEFGIHESLPLFAGGLGVLAGDHLKSASDISLPLTGMGLLYRQGYFRQFLSHDGWQQEEYPETDIYQLPVERARDHSGNEIDISVAGPDGEIHATIWKINVGCIPLYLLDTNLEENSPVIRDITSRLYESNQEKRLAQQILLGVGGIRALEALNIFSTVCHMNEGHSAFSSLERLAQIISKYNVDLKTAMEIVSRTSIFTTHTPVRAGHSEFPLDLVRPYLIPFEDKLGTDVDEILSWGKSENNGSFSMFNLGLRMSQYCNGVSRLHGSVGRRMWSHIWPGRPEDEIPITHITNGMHSPSWLSFEIAELFKNYLGPDWHSQLSNPDIIERIDEIYDEELMRAHEMGNSRLIRHCRRHMVNQYQRRNSPEAMMKEVESVLDRDVLTIVFARRFAVYKRANLLFHDPDRLEAILNSEAQPVQLIFAGKAHPDDHDGKELIKQVTQFASRPSVRHRIIFLENYDINIARHLVQGADVWLNTPRRPFEACGTSGMKAAINGVLNLSILDGWWCEGYSEERGWRIGNGEEYTDTAYQDAVESQALYNVLENDLIPCFYERKSGAAPARWVKMMKESMKIAMQSFCSHRMVGEYEKRFYMPAAKRLKGLIENDAAEAKSLVAQRERFRDLWKDIRIEPPVRDANDPFRVGQNIHMTAKVTLGKLRPDEVEVGLYYGYMKSLDTLTASQNQEMTVMKDMGNGHYLYACDITCPDSGRYGFTARVMPSGDEMIKFTPGFITWA